MKPFVTTLTAVVALLFSTGVWAHHRPDHRPPGQQKLPAPEAVTCSLTEESILVDFDLVEGAGGYQVEYVCLDALSAVIEESLFVEAPPVVEAPEECVVVLAVHVRATQTVGPAGMKGKWSAYCHLTPVE
jgi:hypothetical protein